MRTTKEHRWAAQPKKNQDEQCAQMKNKDGQCTRPRNKDEQRAQKISFQSKSTLMKSEHLFGKKELKSRETSGMSVVESHSVISQVLQLESGLLLEVVYRYGSHYNFYNRRNKDGQCAQPRSTDGLLNQKKIKMSNALK